MAGQRRPTGENPHARKRGPARGGSPPAPTGLPGFAGWAFDGRSFAVLALLLFYLLVALAITAWSFWPASAAAGTPTPAELSVLRTGRAIILAVDCMLLGLALLVWKGPPRLGRWRVPANVAYGLSLVLAIAVMLVASGEVRDWAIARHVPESPQLTREQIFDAARASHEGSFPSHAGEPQPASYFEGSWRRHGPLHRSDLRRLEIRRAGDEIRVRIWHECYPGANPCAADEVTAETKRTADGLIASLAATADIPDGRIWMRMGPGRWQDDVVIVTQVYLRERPEVQVSSGSPVGVWREPPPAPLEEFTGDWSRSFPGELGDLTRLSLRETSPGKHGMRVWARCEEKRECDLGESPLLVEAAPETGKVRAVRSTFSRRGHQLVVSLDPPHQGRSFAVTENSTITYERRRTESGQDIEREKRRSTATRRVALRPGHPAESFASQIAAGPLGTVPAAEDINAGSGCGGAEDLHLAVIRNCAIRVNPGKSKVNHRNRLGQTALALAVLQNKHGAAQALLASGADINLPIRFGEGDWPVVDGLQLAQRPELAVGSTSLIMARDAAMVDLLLQAGAEKIVKNSYGWSAIFYFTHHGSVDMLDKLLAAGAHIDATADVDPSHRGTTALMWAAYMNRTAHLQTLLKHRAKRDIRDAAGKTALDYAKGFGHTEAVRLLSSPGS